MVHNLSLLMINETHNIQDHAPLPSNVSTISMMSEYDPDAILISRSHNQKWIGNDPHHDEFFSNRDIENGLYIYRSLDVGSIKSSHSQEGLHLLLNDPLNSSPHFTRAMTPKLGKMILNVFEDALVSPTTNVGSEIHGTTITQSKMLPHDEELSRSINLFNKDMYRFLPYRNAVTARYLTLSNIYYTLSPNLPLFRQLTFRSDDAFYYAMLKLENEKKVIEKTKRKKVHKIRVDVNGLALSTSSIISASSGSNLSRSRSTVALRNSIQSGRITHISH
jgi:hypothetical protein